MCGIFGIVVTETSHFTLHGVEDTFTRLFKISESRGKEAAGLSGICPDDIRILKGGVSVTEMINTNEYRSFFEHYNGYSGKKAFGRSLAIIGHSRLVTTGTQVFHQNNQTVTNKGVVGIHNGIIINDEELWEEHSSLLRQSEVDTYDWGMVTDIARRNISRMCSKLVVEKAFFCSDSRVFGWEKSLCIIYRHDRN